MMLCLALSCHYRSIPWSLPMSCHDSWSDCHIFENYRSRQIPVFAIVIEVLFLKYLATQLSLTRVFLPLRKTFLYCLFFYFHAGLKCSCLPKILSRQKKEELQSILSQANNICSVTKTCRENAATAKGTFWSPSPTEIMGDIKQFE